MRTGCEGYRGCTQWGAVYVLTGHHVPERRKVCQECARALTEAGDARHEDYKPVTSVIDRPILAALLQSPLTHKQALAEWGLQGVRRLRAFEGLGMVLRHMPAGADTILYALRGHPLVTHRTSSCVTRDPSSVAVGDASPAAGGDEAAA